MNEHHLQRIHQLQLHCRHRVDHQLTGLYRSAFKGQGVEFDEVRPYQPGDDVRAIDWNVTARRGDVHIKQFREERQLNLIFVVDHSPSFVWSSQSRGRLQAASDLCGVLGTTALNSSDRMGVLTFSDGIDNYLPPSGGFTQLIRCLSTIVDPARTGRTPCRTSISEALDQLSRLPLKRSLLVILSDFLFDGYAEPMAALNRHHDLLAIAIDDPAETSLSHGGLICLKDAESDARQWLDMSGERGQRAFLDQTSRRLQRREQEFSHWGLNMISHGADDDPVETLLSCFQGQHQRTSGAPHG